MKIIIVGCGKVGRTLAEQLNCEGHDITVIDQKSEKIENLTLDLDVMGVSGNGASYYIQKEANVENADLLIAVTPSDELNLLCCLIAKKAGNCHTIARVRNPEYNEQINYIKEELGLSMSVNPEHAAAAEIARLLRFPSAIEIDTFVKGKVELLKFQIPKQSILNQISIMNMANKIRSKVLVCAVEREDNVYIPDGSFVLQEKDIISIIAQANQSSEFFKQIGFKTHQVKNAMLIGGGTISYYLAKRLLNYGIMVRIIERDKKRCEFLSDLLPDATIICGDATDEKILLEEGLETIEAFSALTNLDEENIMLSLYARKKSKAKLVTKINRLAFEDIVENMELGSIICPKNITAEEIVRYVRAMQNSLGSNIETLYKIVGNKAEALEFHVGNNKALIGIPLANLPLKNNLLISCINHNGKIITPSGRDILCEGDTVIVVTTNTGLKDLKDILKHSVI